MYSYYCVLNVCGGILIEIVYQIVNSALQVNGLYSFLGDAVWGGVWRLLSCGKRRVINKVAIFNLVIIKPFSEIETLLWMQGDVTSRGFILMLLRTENLHSVD